jgi:preprotein translocase subunit SecA
MHDEVAALGGLCVLGTERHESRRIDNQLRGRSGRQGDPGTSQFFVSLQDDMMRIFGGEQISRLMTYFNFPEDQPLSHSMVNKALESAQQKVEGHNFDIRKHLVEYDDVLNKQREIIYGLRRKMLYALSGDALEIDTTIDQKTTSVLRQIIASSIAIGQYDEQGSLIDQFVRDIHQLFGIEDEQIRTIAQNGDETYIEAQLRNMIKQKLTTKRTEVPAEVWLSVVRSIFLSTIDQYWTLHLTSIDELRDGINLRGFAQLDPLVEYKNEAFKLFEKLISDIEYEVVKRLMSVQITQTPPPSDEEKPKQLIMHAAGGVNAYSNDKENNTKRAELEERDQMTSNKNDNPLSNEYRGVGRNDLCPCGSGKKYKKCHGK